ncbi:hypothetical protein [Rhodococcus erythropolis]|uniref:hypothetical protein n=1 Tax=Rhodococcus erythropolis TaxID=1833 RepID=UPI003014050C
MENLALIPERVNKSIGVRIQQAMARQGLTEGDPIAKIITQELIELPIFPK